MKMGRFFLVLVLTSTGCSLWAQGSASSTVLLKFYEKLAVRDARYEQDLGANYEQDELDYWNDQQDYERQLGKSNFTYYLVYMKSKKEAHREHLKDCGDSCLHSTVYWNRIREYLLVQDTTDIFKVHPGRLAISTRLKNQD